MWLSVCKCLKLRHDKGEIQNISSISPWDLQCRLFPNALANVFILCLLHVCHFTTLKKLCNDFCWLQRLRAHANLTKHQTIEQSPWTIFSLWSFFLQKLLPKKAIFGSVWQMILVPLAACFMDLNKATNIISQFFIMDYFYR